MKGHVTISIDTDLYEKAKSKGCKFSDVCSEALETWILKNMSKAEVEAEAAIIQQDAVDLKYKVEAAKINPAVFNSNYFMKLTRELLSKNGFSESEIDKIIELAKKSLPTTPNQDTEIIKE